MLRWGILGPGSIAGRALAPAMRACGHDLAVVGSRSLVRAQAFAANHGVRRARGSYEDVITAEDVDAVYVSLPNDVHEQWAVAALEAGKHVLCERPLSTNAASAGRIAAASGRNGRVLMEAMATRFHPRTAAALELLRSGHVGELRLVHASCSSRITDPRSYRAQTEHGGGALLDSGVSGVAMSRWFAGSEPTGVRAVQRRWSTGIDGTTSALLAFPNGAVASIHASFDAAPHDLVELVGSDGMLRLPDAFTAGAHKDAVLLQGGEPVGTWRVDPNERMVAAFADAALSGSAAPLPVDDAVATAEVLDRIRTSAV